MSTTKKGVSGDRITFILRPKTPFPLVPEEKKKVDPKEVTRGGRGWMVQTQHRFFSQFPSSFQQWTDSNDTTIS